MKKLVVIIFLINVFSCKSVDDWNQNPVLSINTIEMAKEYIITQQEYLEIISIKTKLDLNDNLSIEELDKQLEIEKSITILSQKVLNAWFDFFLELRQDEGFILAYKGHYYFKKSFETLSLGYKLKRSFENDTKKDKQYQEKITVIEAECRMAIGEIVAYNKTDIDIDKLSKELKKIKKSID